jgi:hypothetical protein
MSVETPPLSVKSQERTGLACATTVPFGTSDCGVSGASEVLMVSTHGVA